MNACCTVIVSLREVESPKATRRHDGELSLWQASNIRHQQAVCLVTVMAVLSSVCPAAAICPVVHVYGTLQCCVSSSDFLYCVSSVHVHPAEHMLC